MSHEKLDYVDLMRQHGFRVTNQRLAILDAVCDAGPHATFGEIYRLVKMNTPSIDQSTIYRTLDVLCEIGLVVSADIGKDGRVYEIARTTPHHHLTCRSCGATTEFSHELVQPLLRQLDTALGFLVQMDHIVLEGICPECRKALDGRDTDRS